MDSQTLKAEADWVRRKTLEMHKAAPGTRVASSLSPVDMLAALFFGGLAHQNPKDPLDPARDRFIASKGHGTLCLYPVLAKLGFFPEAELERVGQEDALLGIIPEALIPGVETTNGSLGHGLGVGAGMAVGLRCRANPATVYVLCGDGEMNSGAVWEAVMFAAQQRLDNLVLMIDDNARSMLGWQKDIMGLDPLLDKLAAFGWATEEVADGHDVVAVHAALSRAKTLKDGRPKAVLCRTVKGRGVEELETDALAHIRVLSADRVDAVLEQWP